MIFIGYTDPEKIIRISEYCAENNVHKTVIISADEFPLLIDGTDQVKYSDVIMYVTFYRLLQQVDQETLIIINECLRTQNRYDLSYNCIRNFLNQTSHQLIFNQLPQIDERDDFMILFDFDTRSRWKRRAFDPFLIQQNARVIVNPLTIIFEKIDVPTSDKTKQRYAQEREKMFRELGKRDPQIIPRNLYLLGGIDKLDYINTDAPLLPVGEKIYIARNKRMKTERVITYEEVKLGNIYGILELPHRFIDFCDFLRITSQMQNEILTTDLKVDQWYFDRYQKWSERINETCSSISS